MGALNNIPCRVVEPVRDTILQCDLPRLLHGSRDERYGYYQQNLQLTDKESLMSPETTVRLDRKKHDIGRRKSMHDSFDVAQWGYAGLANQTCPPVLIETGRVDLTAGDPSTASRTIIYDISEGSVTGH